MTQLRSSRRIIDVFAVVLLASASMPSIAADSPLTPSKEARAAMAQAHEKMAACLRSERALAECRSEMMQACKSTGEASCGMGMMGQGMKHGPDRGASGTSTK